MIPSLSSLDTARQYVSKLISFSFVIFLCSDDDDDDADDADDDDDDDDDDDSICDMNAIFNKNPSGEYSF